MEQLFYLGKRFERQLYSSVFVVIVCVFFYYLCLAINTDKVQQDYNALVSLNDYVLNNKDSILLAKEIQSTYSDYMRKKESNEKLKADNSEEDKKEIALRKKLGLRPKVKKDSQPELPNLDLDYVNKVRGELSLPQGIDLASAAEGIYISMYVGIVIDLFYIDSLLKDKYMELFRTKEIDEIIKSINDDLSSYDNRSLKIVGVDTPLQLPFSVGDVKSKVSLYTIHNIMMISMPIFLLIWFGSMGMTRTRELFFLRKTKSLMSTYPHILNLFFFVDLNVIDKNNRKLIDMALLGSERELKSVKSNAIVIFIMRVAMSTAIFLFMMVPFYYGAFSFVMSSSPFIQGIVFMCLLVNAIQVLIFIYNEFCFHNDTFIHYPREV
ncbi:hypothetical protein ACET8D_19725 [Aeromonas veronii]|uniref:hypothetical protein n=1 Tax=Aeromonas veronii TaxID=654 RepID=UPI0003A0B300|nr:hypothetical protein [Aeromonas veronii]